MSNDHDDALLRRLKTSIELEAEENDRWWSAVEQGHSEALPENGPDLEVLRPLDRAEQEALVQALLTPQEKAKVIPFRRTLITVAATVAVAGVAAIGVLVPSKPVLPQYIMEVSGGEQEFRGDSATGSRQYTHGSVISIVFRPTQSGAPSPTLFTRLIPAKGPPRQVDTIVEHAPGGALRATLVIDEHWPLSPGKHRLVFVLAPADTFKGTKVELDDLPHAAQRFEYPFEYK